MTQKEDKNTIGSKVKRKRKRLYEQFAGDENLINEEVVASAKKTSSKATLYNIQRDKANQIIEEYAKYSAGTGLLPVPVVDIIVIKSIGLKMVKRLCKLYGVEFSEKKGKRLITTLTQKKYMGLWAGSLIKFIPFIGQAGGGVANLFTAGKVTRYVGTVFMKHFEAGGTFFDFDPFKEYDFF
jgi:uncharacterized protein (DUF697 family)